MIDSSLLDVLSVWAAHLNMGVLFIDGSGTLKLLNSFAGTILRVRPEEASGKPVQQLVLEQRLPEAFENSLKNNAIQRFYFNGFNLRMVSIPLHSETGKFSGKIVLLQDDTESVELLKRLEDIERYKNYLTCTLNTVFEDILIVNQEGKIIFVGERTACKMGLYDMETSVLPLEIDTACVLKKIIQTEQSKVIDIWKNHAHTVPTMFLPLYNEDRVLIGAVAKSIFRDLQEAKDFARKYSTGLAKKSTETNRLKKTRGIKFTFDDIIGECRVTRNIKEIARRAAQTDSTVLLLGESGTGKEMFAHAIHATSSRASGPFVRINCAAIPESLLESELFGYEEGAFSGARKGGKPGKFELAHGGTIFLDEIGDMGMNIQTKLLRVLQEREIEKIGGLEPMEVDVRIIAATNQDLQENVKKGTFREDLYYRLDVISIRVPGLRERMEDMPLLVDYLLSKLNYYNGTSVIGLSSEVSGIFLNYSWPGNIRELENVLEGSTCFCGSGLIGVEHLPLHFKQRTAEVKSIPQNNENLESTLDDIEKRAIRKALTVTGGNKKDAATMLGVPRSTFYYKLKRYGIN